MIQLLAGVSNVEFVSAKPEKSIGAVGDGYEVFIIVDENINKEQLLARFQKEITKEEGYIKNSEKKLSNQKFTEHAAPEVVQAEKDKLELSRRRVEKLNSYIKSL